MTGQSDESAAPAGRPARRGALGSGRLQRTGLASLVAAAALMAARPHGTLRALSLGPAQVEPPRLVLFEIHAGG